jgi:hypothetical protein
MITNVVDHGDLFRRTRAHEVGVKVEASGDENADTAETARRDLDRIFNTGGVAALVGKYGAAKDVGVYVTVRRYEDLLILKRRNESAVRALPPKPSLLVLPSAQYGWLNDKAS